MNEKKIEWRRIHDNGEHISAHGRFHIRHTEEMIDGKLTPSYELWDLAYKNEGYSRLVTKSTLVSACKDAAEKELAIDNASVMTRMENTKPYYFTYGTSRGMPYQGGWTVVIAPKRSMAEELFRMYHPDKTPGTINCAGIYTEEQFRNTRMYESGNFGKREQEIICLQKSVITPMSIVSCETN